MPKLKSNRGAMKRFKLSSSGKIKRHKAYKSHILTKKSPKRKRDLRSGTYIATSDEHRVKKMILA